MQRRFEVTRGGNHLGKESTWATSLPASDTRSAGVSWPCSSPVPPLLRRLHRILRTSVPFLQVILGLNKISGHFTLPNTSCEMQCCNSTSQLPSVTPSVQQQYGYMACDREQINLKS